LEKDLAKYSLKTACELAWHSAVSKIGILNLQNGFPGSSSTRTHNSLMGRYLCWCWLRRKVHSAAIAAYFGPLPSDSSTSDYERYSAGARLSEATYLERFHEDLSCDCGFNALKGCYRVTIIVIADCYSSSLCFKGIEDLQCYLALIF
jgi:hypothetical protein